MSPCAQYVHMQQLKSDIIQCIHVTVWIFPLKIPFSCWPKEQSEFGSRQPVSIWRLLSTHTQSLLRNNCHLENNSILKLLRHKFQNLEEVCYTN